MQTPTILPIQVSGASAAPNNANLNANGAADSQFQQTLSREIENRQQEDRQNDRSNAPSAAPAPSPAPAQTAPAPTQQQSAPPEQSASPAPTSKDSAPPPGQAGSADAVTKPASSKGKDSKDDAADAAAAASTPVTAMLALVASFNQPQVAATGTAPTQAADASVDALGSARTAAAGAAVLVATGSSASGAAVATTANAADADAKAGAAFAAALDKGAAAIATPANVTATALAAAPVVGAKAAAVTTAAVSAGGAGKQDLKLDAATPRPAIKAISDAPAVAVTKTPDTPTGVDATPLASTTFQAKPLAAGSAAADTAPHVAPLAGDGAAQGGPVHALADPVQIPRAATAPTIVAREGTISSIAAAGAMQAGALEATHAGASVPADTLAGRVGSPAWDEQLGQKVVWMVAGGQQSASLTLNPPDLGPLQVVLNVHNDQATATFTAAQPEVRQALEAALPRLREMMGDAGISLGSATVNTGMPGQHQAQGEQSRQNTPSTWNDAGSASAAIDTSVRAARPVARSDGLGMVDTFA